MWIERNDWMIRDDDEGQYQCDPLRYGMFAKIGERKTFDTLKEAIEYVMAQKKGGLK